MDNLNDFCSLCLKFNSNLKNVIYMDEDGTIIQEKLSDFLPECILMDAEISVYICNHCLEVINNTLTFKKQCLDNIKILNEYVNQLKSVDNSSKYLSIKLNDVLYFKEYKISQEKLKDSNIKSDDTNIENIVIKIEDGSDNEETTKKEINDEYVVRDEDIPNHFLDCDVSTNAENDGKNTVSTTGETSNTAIKKPLECTECGKTFIFKCYLDRHMHIHAEKKPLECQICQKRFSLPDHLKRHTMTHTGERPFSCGVCGKPCISTSNLKTHFRTHINEKPYKCTVCDKSFGQSGSLKTHFRIHSGVKPYACHLCEAKFNQTANLNQHMRIHYGLKPYNCEICQEAFRQLSGLKRHLRIKHKIDKKNIGLNGKCKILPDKAITS